MFIIGCFQLYFLPAVDMLSFVEGNLFHWILVGFPMVSGKACPFFHITRLLDEFIINKINII
jgi:hypothetical protein